LHEVNTVIRSLIFISVLGCGAAWALKPATFSARRDYPILGFVAVGDINGDGIPDIVAEYENVTNSMLGNGDGTFRLAFRGVVPWALAELGALADVNGDGILDLIIGGQPIAGIYSPAGVGVCFGNGDGSFEAPIFYQTGTDSTGGTPIVGDFNNDGIPDLVMMGTSGIWLFTGAGAGVFNPGVLTPVATDFRVLAADFNRDGNLDLVVTASGGFLVIFGNGNGTFQPPVSYAAAGNCLALGDITRNGRADIAIGAENGGKTIEIFLNNGQGVFTLSGMATLSGFEFTIGDINGDGVPDIVDAAGCVALGEGHAKFAPDYCYAAPIGEEGAYNVVLADLRKNGSLDMTIGAIDVAAVLLNEGGGQLEDGLWLPLAGAGNCGANADYNGDGKPDLAVPTTSGIAILLGTSDANAPYTTGTTIEVAGGVGCPVSGDVNNDGIPDLVFGSNRAGGLVVYLGNGDGSFRYASTIPFNPSHFVLSDFNNDGRLDIAGASNQLSWGRGNGSFETPITIDADAPFGGFNWVAAGDLNNDGWMDLMLPAAGANELYVLLNNHHGGFTASTVPANYNEGSGPETVALADLNRDGNLDAVVEMAYGYSVAVFLGNGEGGFTLTSKKLIQYVGSYPQPPQVGDVNGDGIPDILMPASGSLGIAYGIGNGTFTSQLFVGTGNGAGQIILTNIHGQPASEDLPDIVEPDDTGGVMVLINTTPKM
jgi:hypothetical protein